MRKSPIYSSGTQRGCRAWAGGLGALQGDVLVGRGVGIIRDRTKTRFSDSRPHTVDEGQLPDRRDHRVLVNQLLDLVQGRLAMLVVQLCRLFLEKCVDVWVAPVGLGPALDDKGLDGGSQHCRTRRCRTG
jgi:hypothetical protein